MLWYCLPMKTLRSLFPSHYRPTPPRGEMAEGRLEGGHVFNGVPTEKQQSDLILYQCWQLFQVVKTNGQTWKCRAFAHRLLQNQAAGSCQCWRVLRTHCRFTGTLWIQLETGPLVSPTPHTAKSVFGTFLICTSVDFRVYAHRSITISVLKVLLYFDISTMRCLIIQI